MLLWLLQGYKNVFALYFCMALRWTAWQYNNCVPNVKTISAQQLPFNIHFITILAHWNRNISQTLFSIAFFFIENHPKGVISDNPLPMPSNGNYFLHYWPFVRESTGGFPSQIQWRGALMFSLISAWTNGSTNNRDAGDLKRHRTYHDVTVMSQHILYRLWSLNWFHVSV